VSERLASGGAARARRGESGQALLVALVTLLIAGVAAGLVGTDIALRQRAMREELTRAHLRAMIDGEMATALALLDEGHAQPTERRRWAGGEVEAERTTTATSADAIRYTIFVRARYFASWAAARADVLVPAGRPPQVLHFERLPAAAAVPRSPFE
jgi:hypothetical protein